MVHICLFLMGMIWMGWMSSDIICMKMVMMLVGEGEIVQAIVTSANDNDDDDDNDDAQAGQQQ